MKTVIRGGKVIDPANKVNGFKDVVIDKGKIEAILAPGQKVKGKIKEIDASGCVVSPGFVDIHVHFREPGFEQKETVQTGTAAAVAGGVTSVACMANTDPVNDNATVTGYILSKAKSHGLCKVYPIGAATKNLQGEFLTEMGGMKDAGIVAVSDDGRCIMNAQVARRAMEYAAMFDLPVIVHAEDENLASGGCMNAGFVSTELGLPGCPAGAEEIMISRDLILSRMTNAAVHVAHVSTEEGLKAIRQAKDRGVKVTCEATPHHFTLTDCDICEYNTLFKVAPPLRTESDRDAVIAGLADGTVDCIASDHAPHEALLKDCEFDKAANGMIGLESMLPLTLALVRKKKITMKRAIELLTCGPAKVIGLHAGTLSKGAPADVTVFDPKEKWVYSLETIRSRSHNSPWLDETFTGKVKFTFVDGKQVYKG